jgi:hypothetical protein
VSIVQIAGLAGEARRLVVEVAQASQLWNITTEAYGHTTGQANSARNLLRRPELNPRTIKMRFMMDTVTTGRFLPQNTSFLSCQLPFYSLIYNLWLVQ